MSDKFLRRLSQFARAIDSVDPSILDSIEGRFYDYMRHSLKVCYYEVCVEGKPVEDDAGCMRRTLETRWCMLPERRGRPVDLIDGDANPCTQKAYSFLNNSPLWITPRDGRSLLHASADLDYQWCVATGDVPGYRDYDPPGRAMTSVLMPLRYGEQVLGTLDVEFPAIVEFAEGPRDHMKLLAHCLATILYRFRATQKSTADTRGAFGDLVSDLDFRTLNVHLQKSRLFLSYAEHADPAVIGLIKDVVAREFHDKVALVDWRDLCDPGPITPRVVDAIRDSQFGLCYLSEPAPEDQAHDFHDNSNVLFEAGMMHLRRDNKSDSLVGWLPVREASERAGPIPFNFAGDRLLEVPRTGEGRVNEPLFRQRLKDHVEQLVAS